MVYVRFDRLCSINKIGFYIVLNRCVSFLKKNCKNRKYNKTTFYKLPNFTLKFSIHSNLYNLIFKYESILIEHKTIFGAKIKILSINKDT